MVENHDSQVIFCLYIYWSEKVDTLWFSTVQSVKALNLNKNMLCELNFTILHVKFVQFLLVCTIFHSNYVMLFRKEGYTIALMLYLSISHLVEMSVIYRFFPCSLSHGYFKKLIFCGCQQMTWFTLSVLLEKRTWAVRLRNSEMSWKLRSAYNASLSLRYKSGLVSVITNPETCFMTKWRFTTLVRISFTQGFLAYNIVMAVFVIHKIS